LEEKKTPELPPQKIAKGVTKHFEVVDYGDSIIEKLNNLFTNVIKKVVKFFLFLRGCKCAKVRQK